MNPTALAHVAKRLAPGTLRQHPLFHDSASVITLAVTAALNLVTLVLLVIKVHQLSYPVPTHYLSLVGFDQTGSWVATYQFALFSIAVMVVNSFLAMKSFQRHRLTSFFLLLGASVVSLLCLVVALAFAAVA